MSRQIEVLAPAGSMEILQTALNAGADAVYVGGSRFGARAYADNFDEAALLSAIRRVHLYGKKLYLAVNTLLMQDEIEQLFDFLKAPYEEGLDAVIVQDLGVAAYIHRQFPELCLHASTQMSITNTCGSNLLKDLGVKRLVPARELSIGELSELKKQSGMELEVFVHGALCYCYSGNCLLSSMIGGRSGNRGRCAQPCRLPYRISENTPVCGYHNEPYLLSPRDLCALDYLPQLIAMGVDSLKIEGRMKNSSYVACVVSAYRSAVDAAMLGEYTDDLKAALKRQMAEIYNRGGFTDGYFSRYNGREMMSMVRPNHAGILVGHIEKTDRGAVLFRAAEDIFKGDVLTLSLSDGSELNLTSPAVYKKGSMVRLNAPRTKQVLLHSGIYRTKNAILIDVLTGKYIENEKKENIKIEVTLKKGFRAKMEMTCRDESVCVQGAVVTAAGNRPLTKEIVIDKVSRLGATPFTAEEIIIHMDEDGFLPMSELNELRRNAVETMVSRLCRPLEQKHSRQALDGKENEIWKPRIQEEGKINIWEESKTIISAYCYNQDILNELLQMEQVSRIYLDTILMEEDQAVKAAKRVKEQGKLLILCFPHIFRQSVKESFSRFLTRLGADAYDGFMVRTIDGFGYLVQQKDSIGRKHIIGDASLYAYNRQAIAYYRQYFPDMQFIMPRELSCERLKALAVPNLICDIYGNEPVMISAQCMEKNVNKCSFENGQSGGGRKDDNKNNPLLHMKDRKNVEYDVQCVCKYCYNLIYNNIEYCLFGLEDEVKSLKPNELRLVFRNQDPSLVRALIEYTAGEYREEPVYGYGAAYKNREDKEIFLSEFCKKTTRGHFKRGIE